MWHYLRDTVFSRFDTIPECDRHTDTDTRRHIPRLALCRAVTRDLALASMAQDDPPASSTAISTAAAIRGKVGSEFET